MDCNIYKPWEIRVGDVLDKLREMPAESVHCCITSPPYFGLRDYGVDGQIGLESSPEAFVAKMVDVFREVRRVLRADGTLWLNLGDSYSGGGRGNYDVTSTNKGNSASKGLGRPTCDGLKAKDLVGIPWWVAFALQADGWYLRSDIIWSKPNPMPESVTDRPTKAHEYLFLLTKSAHYFYDTEGAKEPAQSNHPSGNGFKREARLSYRDDKGARGNDLQWTDVGGRRNRRTVWSVPTQPFKDAHFATFPPKLIEPCIQAGTSDYGCCVSCGSPYRRETKKVDSGRRQKMADGWDTGEGGHGTFHREGREAGRKDVPVMVTVTIGWNPACDCVPNTPVPCTVLDPFAGAATTLLVATQHGRSSIGIELNPEYAALAERRLLTPPKTKTKKVARKKELALASNLMPPSPAFLETPLFA
jgi:DNA modification methylase